MTGIESRETNLMGAITVGIDARVDARSKDNMPNEPTDTDFITRIVVEHNDLHTRAALFAFCPVLKTGKSKVQYNQDEFNQR